PLDARTWAAVLASLSFLRVLDQAERDRLERWVTLFLCEKKLLGADGLTLDDSMRYAIGAQACMLILELDLEYFRGWSEIIVYPDEFLAPREFMDEAGVMHAHREALAGEAWLSGPVILSWADAAPSAGGDGVNVVLHEFAHKLDMLNGETNGFPPLHRDMSREAWCEAFESAYRDFCERVDRGEHTRIDPYASEHPAEFFAVMTEGFFETPAVLRQEYPDVYRQLTRFYRQDPHARLGRAGAWERIEG
ncbi:MAG: zinc-dependent peptidase, partial [Burkholderiales bacterium]|nr:zinc-dependent peptidase [Burkholderiales bacterium]